MFKAPDIQKGYEFYFLSVYSSSRDYQMKVISDERVSGNLSLKLDSITDLDTFRSLIFIESFRSNKMDVSMFKTLNMVFDRDFLKVSDFVWPVFDKKLFKYEKPRFVMKNEFVRECAFILDLIGIDIEEAILYVKENNKKLFSDIQIELLLNSIKQVESKSS